MKQLTGSLTERLLHVLFLWAMAFAGLWIIFGNGIYMAAVWAILCFLCCRIQIGCFCPVLLGAALLSRVAVVFVLKPEPVSDFLVILEASQSFAAGDMSFQSNTYFQRWPGQTGQVVFQGLVLQLCNSIAALKLINCLAGAGTTVLVYKTARRFFSETPSRAAGAFYAFSVVPMTMPTLLSNQNLGTFLMWLCIWLITSPLNCTGEYRAYMRYPAGGLCLALANAIRPDALTALVAVAAFCVFGAAGRGRALFQNLRRYALIALLFFGSYLGSFNLMSLGVAAAGINSAGLSGGDFLLKLLFGMNLGSRGQYSNEVLEALSVLKQQGMSHQEAEKALLLQKLHLSMGELLKLFDDKQTALWTGSSLAWAMTPWQESHPFWVYLAKKGEYFCSLCSLLLGLAGFFYSRRTRTARLESLLPAFLVFANFTAYLFIEVQPRYVYGVQPALYVLAAGGLEALGESLRLLFKDRREKS